MPASQNAYVFAYSCVFIRIYNLFIKYLLKYFLCFLLHFRQLNINNSSLVDIYSRQALQSVHLSMRSPSERLLRRLDNELGINLMLSINLILYVIVLLFSCFSFILLKRLCTFLCFLQDIQSVLQILLLTLGL